MLLRLKVTDGSNAGKEIIIDRAKFLIGRADDCNLRPHSDGVSRRHCVIIKTDKAVGVRDLKSRNGTLVNGDKITGDKRLRNGDTLDVGPLKFEVIIEHRAPVEKELPAKKAKNAEGAGKGSGDKGMGGMVSQWLEEADDVAREEQRIGSPETREYRFDETSRIELDQAAAEEAAKKETAALEVEAETDGKKKKKAKKEPTKLPKFEVKTDAPKDTHEAAQQVLRKLFNRG
jgi:pSer/pThr/pTyr-binding forkhead associated (FHA) protein